MQNQRINWQIKGLIKIADLAYEFENMTKSANDKYNILCFLDKYGFAATIDAFGISKRTLYYWRQKLKDNGKLGLNDKSKAPINKRVKTWDADVVDEIKYLRDIYPNIGKNKLHPLIDEFCKKHNLDTPSISTIGRIIANDKNKMRTYPKKINHFGKKVRVNRQKVLRKPKDLQAKYPGHIVALDTIEKRINGSKQYILTFIDLYTRFAYAYATKKHTADESVKFLDNAKIVFPFTIKNILTDNGSEFKKDFAKSHTHYHTYPKTPKMNAHCERFNRTLQEECIDYEIYNLDDIDELNYKLSDYLFWYNTKRPHYGLGQISPIEYIKIKEKDYKKECNMCWTYTIKEKSAISQIPEVIIPPRIGGFDFSQLLEHIAE
jgi:transposase InsO family protein